MVKVKIKKQGEEAMPGLNSAHMCLSAVAAVFSHAVRHEGTAKNCGDVQQVAEVNQTSSDLTYQRTEERKQKKLSNTDISLATGFHQSQGRITITGTNLLRSLSLCLSCFSEKKKKVLRYELHWANESGFIESFTDLFTQLQLLSVGLSLSKSGKTNVF